MEFSWKRLRRLEIMTLNLKRKFKIKSLTTSGVTLIEIMIGLGIGAVFSLMMAGSIHFTSKQNKTNLQKDSFNQLVSIIRLFMNNERACAQFFNYLGYQANQVDHG